jgi:hypothetical protein
MGGEKGGKPRKTNGCWNDITIDLLNLEYQFRGLIIHRES